jgi:hypothetical protein
MRAKAQRLAPLGLGFGVRGPCDLNVKSVASEMRPYRPVSSENPEPRTRLLLSPVSSARFKIPWERLFLAKGSEP